MTAARAADGVLLIAKLDRLGRNASFILALRDSGVDFVCCEMPDATARATLGAGRDESIAVHDRGDWGSVRVKQALVMTFLTYRAPPFPRA